MDLKPSNIFRTSINTFLRNYQYFTSIPTLLVFPFAASVLLSQIFVPSSLLLPTVFNRVKIVLSTLGFPGSSHFLAILNLKLSQTTLSAIFSFPLRLTCLLLSKASIINYFRVDDHKHLNSHLSYDSLASVFNPLFVMSIHNAFVILLANETAFFILFISFSFLQDLGLSSSSYLLFFSASGIVIYSIILANVIVICNLSLILSGMERSGGYTLIVKAYALIRERASTALSLALPLNLCLAAIEALFQYRVVRNYHVAGGISSSLVLEGLFIAYLYSIGLVLDTVVTCIFYKFCKSASSCADQKKSRGDYRIEIIETDPECGFMRWKVSQQLS